MEEWTAEVNKENVFIELQSGVHLARRAVMILDDPMPMMFLLATSAIFGATSALLLVLSLAQPWSR